MPSATISRWEQLRIVKALGVLIQAREATLREYRALTGSVTEWQEGPYKTAVDEVAANYQDEIIKLQELQQRIHNL